MSTKNTPTITTKAEQEALLTHGWHCFHGKTTPQDFAMAAQCWQKAANAGNRLAMYNLACLYMHGKGVEVDHARGLELLKESSVRGSIRARDALRDVNNIGQHHFHVASRDINFERRRLYIIIALIILLALVTIAIIQIPNQFGFGL